MHMNWGKGIAIALALFMGFIIYLAVTLMTTNVDLETEDYYIRELSYEDEINAVKNAQEGDPVKLELKEEHIVVQVPQGESYKDVQIQFKRPDNDKLDKTFDIKGTKMMALDRSMFVTGEYKVEISYLNGDKPCLIKDKIYI